jgi:hypothetical protein
MVRYKTIKQFSAESGYSEAAIRTKVHDGTWPEGLVYMRAPDGRVLISVEGYASWVESAEYGRPQRVALKSVSCSTARNAASASRLSPAPLI